MLDLGKNCGKLAKFLGFIFILFSLWSCGQIKDDKTKMEEQERAEKENIVTESDLTSKKIEDVVAKIEETKDNLKNNFGKQEVNSLSLSAKGDTPWDLKAEKIQYDDNSKRARASRVVWNLLDKDGKSLFELSGDAAVVNVATQGIAFEGPVRAKGAHGEEITCQKLVWDSKNRRLHGSNGVKVVREGSIMTGQEMIASPDLKQVEVKGNVRVSFTANPLKSE